MKTSVPFFSLCSLSQVTEAYKEYDYSKVVRLLQAFCSRNLSNFYFSIIKDRWVHYSHQGERRKCKLKISPFEMKVVTRRADVEWIEFRVVLLCTQVRRWELSYCQLSLSAVSVLLWSVLWGHWIILEGNGALCALKLRFKKGFLKLHFCLEVCLAVVFVSLWGRGFST